MHNNNNILIAMVLYYMDLFNFILQNNTCNFLFKYFLRKMKFLEIFI